PTLVLAAGRTAKPARLGHRRPPSGRQPTPLVKEAARPVDQRDAAVVLEPLDLDGVVDAVLERIDRLVAGWTQPREGRERDHVVHDVCLSANSREKFLRLRHPDTAARRTGAAMAASAGRRAARASQRVQWPRPSGLLGVVPGSPRTRVDSGEEGAVSLESDPDPR